MLSARHRSFRRALMTSTAAIAACAVSASALAQQQQSAESDEEELELEEIIVTGSRIGRSGFDTATPTVTIDAEFMDRRGFFDTLDMLEETPFVLGSIDPEGGQGSGGVGQSFADIFNLGVARTLTLVDGKRFVAGAAPSPQTAAAAGSAVDLNTIPTAVIERTEVVTVGGAPIYGSDAVAGTINFILKDDFEGINVDVQGGISEKGDADRFRARGIVGGNFADGKGNAFFSAEFSTRDGLRSEDRRFVFEQEFFVPNPENTGPEDGIPAEILITDRTVPFLSTGGNVSLGVNQPLFFNPDGTLTPLDPPTEQFSAVTGSGGDDRVLRLGETSQISSEVERILTYGKASFEVSDAVNLYVEGNFASTEATELLNQASFSSVFFPGDQGNIGLSIDNPFLTEQARQALIDNGVTDQFILERTNLDLAQGGGPSTTETTQFRVITGFDGEFKKFGRNFNYDIFLNFSRNNISSFTPELLDLNFLFAADAVEIGQNDLVDGSGDPRSGINVVRNGDVVLTDPTNPVQVGDIVCSVVLDPPQLDPNPNDGFDPQSELFSPVDNCVPINLFGAGAASPEAIDFVSAQFFQNARNELVNVVGFLGFEAFELPAGWVDAVIGFEHRQESGRFQPDSGLSEGILTSIGGGAIGPTQGSFETFEGFAETQVPVISPDMDIPGVESLTVEGAIRFISNDRAGDEFIFTAGGRWRITEDVLVRGNRTRSVRAPSIAELFSPISPTLSFGTDPCAEANIGAGPDPSVRRRNCEAAAQALGLDPAVLNNFVSDFDFFAVPGTTGGNPNLESEVANSYTVGLEITPRWVPGLSLSADYVDINITDVIGALTPTDALNACFDDTDGFGNDFCDLVQRNPNTFQITSFESGQFNSATLNFEGVQGQASYAFGVDEIVGSAKDLGTVRLSGDFLYYLTFSEQVLPTSGVEDNVGELQSPRYRFRLNLGYDYDRFSFFLQSQFFPSVFAGDNTDTIETQDLLKTESYVELGLTVGYQILDNVRWQLVVDNLTDSKPPIPFQNGPVAPFDSVGRTFLSSVVFTF